MNHLQCSSLAFLKSAINISGCLNDEEIYYGMAGGHKSLAPISSTFQASEDVSSFQTIACHPVVVICLFFYIHNKKAESYIYYPIDFFALLLHIQRSHNFDCEFKERCLFDEGWFKVIVSKPLILQ